MLLKKEILENNRILKERHKKAIERLKKIQSNAIKYGAIHDANLCQDLIDILRGVDNYDKDKM